MTGDTEAVLAASAPQRRRRRPHDEAFKRQVLAACEAPGASVAAVALAHGLNANLVQTWRRRARAKATRASETMPSAPAASVAAAPEFIALPIAAARSSAPAASMPSAEISVEIRRGAATIAVRWPIAAAAECAAWLRDLVR